MCGEEGEGRTAWVSKRGRLWRKAEKEPGTQGPPKTSQPFEPRLRIQNYSE